MRRIILASKSKQRKMLMDAINIPYEIIPAEIDEKSIRNENLSKQVEIIARTKAEKISAIHQEAIIISADTCNSLNNQILEKPMDRNEAIQMLEALSDKIGISHNGFCYIDNIEQINFSATVNVKFKFRKIFPQEIAAYTQKFPVTTWAAAYSPAYPYAMTFVEYIEGSLTGFTHGLPMDLVIRYLDKSGVQVRP